MTKHVQLDPQAASTAPDINAAMAAIEQQLNARDAKIAALEQRLDEQEYSVRRVLEMLVDWLEEDGTHAQPVVPSVSEEKAG